jgi:hypothetical protein
MMAIHAGPLSKIIKKFLLVAVAFSFPFLMASALARRFDIAAALAVGAAVGMGDNAIMLGGIVKGSKKSGAKAFALMKKSMLERILVAGAACFLAAKAGINILWFFLAFCLTHVACLVFMVIIAQEDAKFPKCGKE